MDSHIQQCADDARAHVQAIIMLHSYRVQRETGLVASPTGPIVRTLRRVRKKK